MSEKEILNEAEETVTADTETASAKTEAASAKTEAASAKTEAEEVKTEESATTTANAEEEKTTKKSGCKKKKTDKKSEAYEAKIAELEDRVKRQMAEFENFRKRTEKEKSVMYEMGAKGVVEKILPVVDNFERGLAAIPEADQNSPFAEGMNMIYKQLMTELDKLGVKPIEAVGCEFDPNIHNAVMQVESDEFEEGIVAQELQKGYMYRESVVRHSMVAVAQ